ncbi:hypothetical protein BC792_10923 [Sphingobacterium allocomposti]|uniref:DUF5703 domain-containing protein n=1 Tax=Sphingobacterium allocomposti TaxID=415956 RepID=A0A5S5DIR9_9SPHI|nr:DUF5703 domain-containing protein [Sphingobacterium composti Yoo et al. 2007 non Ten et al. 2007]TYP95827.1 hypothetical protein BC792_10923 [Sphingobacterium composti Yoo et al. 2007 non Ten et al. 2007]
MKRYILVLAFCLNVCVVFAQDFSWKDYNVLWTAPSKSSAESMPVGGGDIGLNVWVENGDILFYLGKSGAFDENNTLLKLGRVRLTLSPNPFEGRDFRQELQLDKGHIVLEGQHRDVKAKVLVWVDVHTPNVHVEVEANKKISMEASYESWRYKDLYPQKKENNANSWKWAPPHRVVTHKDSIRAADNAIVFYHKNRDTTAFDIVVRQQQLTGVKDSLYNPLAGLISGGLMQGDALAFVEQREGRYADTDFRAWVLRSRHPRKTHHVQVTLLAQQTDGLAEWVERINRLAGAERPLAVRKKRTEAWWRAFWERSYIAILPQNQDKEEEAWRIGRNYQLFRYMLACNAYGEYPTKFNGGLFTYDPSGVDSTFTFTPDFRNWGGGTHTAQNQRLVYWPMLKSGDFDMMPAQFKFYQRLQRNAEWRSKVYWGHDGASFTEQLENFGLPNPAEYNWKRPKDYDAGLEYNAWLEYQWDTVLEFCMMMLETQNYGGKEVQTYIPFIESCLRFFDEHYQYRARQSGSKVLDQQGHLIFYPGSSAETYKMAYNASTTVAALQEVTKRMLSLTEVKRDTSLSAYLTGFQKRIPPLPTREIDGKKVLAPAQLWARLNNTEAPQLYPVFPWGIYGVGKAELEVARNTYWLDPDLLKFRSHVGWKQDNIFAARLGLTDEAKRLTLLKLGDAPRRFPTFWGPGFDWVPDHNWGGSGMIGLQEMLLQTADDKIYLFPAWPREWDVDFKLHAPQQTTVQGKLRGGKLVDLHVVPAARREDVVNLLDK